MEVADKIERLRNFLELYYKEELIKKLIKKKDRLIIDFPLLISFDADLAEEIIDKPEETFLAITEATERILDGWKINNIRIKDLTEEGTKKSITQLRNKDVDKLRIIEGVIRQRKGVILRKKWIRYECLNCSGLMTVFQEETQIKQRDPIRCSCGRQGKLKEVDAGREHIYSMAVEESADTLESMQRTRFHILCKEDMADKDVISKLNGGASVKITGIIKRKPLITASGSQSIHEELFMIANYAEIMGDQSTDLSWNEKDVNEFRKLAKQPDWLERLRRSVFFDIVGYKEETEGVLLQMFGGAPTPEAKGIGTREQPHILLAGGPGSCKTTILKLAQRFSPKSIYTAGHGASGVGLTVSVVKDELLGGFAAEAGALVLANDGLCCIDELDKIKPEDLEALNEPMSERTVSINKAGINACFNARTTVLAAANPKYGTYSVYEDIFSQINIPIPFANRFDLIYPIHETEFDREDHYAVAKKILQRGSKSEKEPELSREFVKKYIAYAKTINPVISDELIDQMSNLYADVRQMAKRKVYDETNNIPPISPRNIEALKRLSQAVARSRLSAEVSEEDMNLAFKKINYSLKRLGIDPSTGEVQTLDIGGVKVPKETMRDVRAAVTSYLRKNCPASSDTVIIDDVIIEMEKLGFEYMQIDRILTKMKDVGEITEPRRGRIRLI